MQYFPYSWNEQLTASITQTLIVRPLKPHAFKKLFRFAGWFYAPEDEAM